MSKFILEFEKPIKKIEDEIQALKSSSISTGINVDDKLNHLYDKLNQEYINIYSIIFISYSYRIPFTQHTSSTDHMPFTHHMAFTQHMPFSHHASSTDHMPFTHHMSSADHMPFTHHIIH